MKKVVALLLLMVIGILFLIMSCSRKPSEIEEMVFVEGGTFQMGSNVGDLDEKPVHQVTVSDFYIGKYEVTQKEWVEIMGSNPSHFKGDNLPVEKVSWFDAIEYCNKRSVQEGLNPVYSINGNTSPSDWTNGKIVANWDADGYRLPTEAEWEYSARGGNKSRGFTYSGSNTIGEVAWYRDNSGRKTNSVGQKKPNELGIYDMTGNVWE
jgi:formylglycine-generating enzyme